MSILPEQAGIALKGSNFTVVKKIGKAGDEIPRHNHPEANVLFTIVKGKIEVFLNDVPHMVTPGQMIHFDGVNYINAKLHEDSEAYVTLILK
ncbi:MAG: cupin domain-containing protein [Bacillota bacterium]|nr:cupin domain-containing protein [Bacillota bacterium]